MTWPYLLAVLALTFYLGFGFGRRWEATGRDLDAAVDEAIALAREEGT